MSAAPLEAALAAIPADMEPFARARLRAMVIGYATLWDGEDVEVLAVEREFRFPLVRPDGVTDPDWLVGGKIDALLRWNGRALIVEHKTSSEDASADAYRARLVMGGQATHYMLAAESLGMRPDGLLWDVLKKPAQRPLKAGKTRKADETPDEYLARCAEAISAAPADYYARIDVPRLEAEREAYLRDLYRVTTLIDTAREYDLAARSVDACHSFGRPCAFFDACSGGASIDDPSIYRKKKSAHSELDVPLPAGKRLITTSRRSAFQRCHELERLAYHVGVERVREDENLSFGTATHRALEAFWKAWPRQGAIDAAA